MTSRERVQRAVNFQPVDRVPIDLGGMKASSIAVEAYAHLQQKLGIHQTPRVFDPRFMIAVVEEPVRKRFHLDVRSLDLTTVSSLMRPAQDWVPRRLFSGTEVLMPPETKISVEADGSWVLLNADGTPTAFHMPKGGFYFDDVSFDNGSGIDPTKFKPVDGFSDETLNEYARYGKTLYDNTDAALLGWGGGVCFLGMSLITDRRSNVTMGMPSEWMMMLMTEKETCHEMMNRSVEASIKCLTQLHQAVGPYCFAWGIAADDSGTQRGEFINPDLWTEMIKPHYRKLCDWIHKNTSWKTFFHCCGSINNLIPHFIDAGIDILNPVQTSAANMDPARLKQEYGKQVVFWGGGCDTQRVLNLGTPAEIRQQVKERMAIFKPGSGYVFNQVHNIQANVPAENIIAMFDAAYEFGTGA